MSFPSNSVISVSWDAIKSCKSLIRFSFSSRAKPSEVDFSFCSLSRNISSATAWYSSLLLAFFRSSCCNSTSRSLMPSQMCSRIVLRWWQCFFIRFWVGLCCCQEFDWWLLRWFPVRAIHGSGKRVLFPQVGWYTARRWISCHGCSSGFGDTFHRTRQRKQSVKNSGYSCNCVSCRWDLCEQSVCEPDPPTRAYKGLWV